MIDVVQIQLRHDTLENWIAANPVLSLGEFALVSEATTNDYFVSLKIGDGVKSWIELPLLFISKKEYNLFVEKSSITNSLGDSTSSIVTQKLFSSYIYKLYGIEVIQNLSNFMGYYNNGVAVNNRDWATSDYVPSDQVTIKNVKMRCIISFWDKDKNFISQVGSLTEVYTKPMIVYPANTAYFTLSYYFRVASLSDLKIEIARNIVDLNGIRNSIDEVRVTIDDIYNEIGISNLDTANAIELDSDIDGSIYASIGKDGNIDVTSDDEGFIYMIYDTDKLDIKDVYEDMNGNLIVEQNKVMIL